MSNLTKIQINFLNDLIEKKSPVAVYLKNGIKLKGIILGYDEQAIILDQPGQQLILKDAISTIAPLLTFQNFTSST
jgi:host factor-I protein